MISYDKEITLCDSLAMGYLIFCDYEHPLAINGRFVYYHRHVASLKVGHWLTSEEQVHHVDGNPFNNDPDNLMVVSKSEHGKIEAINRGQELLENSKCSNCGKQLTNSIKKSKTGLCDNCYKPSRKFDPDKRELARLIWSMPMTKIAKIFNVSNVAIAKRCRLFGIETPPIGYWIKNNPLDRNEIVWYNDFEVKYVSIDQRTGQSPSKR